MITRRLWRRAGALTLALVLVGMATASVAMGAVVRYEEDSPEIVYGPSAWQTWSWTAGKSYRYTQMQNATVDFAFTGTGVEWRDSKGAVFGIAQVWVDNEAPVSVDLYAPLPTQREVLLFSRMGLTPGNHTLHIRNTNTKNPTSTNYQIGLDFIEVTSPDVVSTPASSGWSILLAAGLGILGIAFALPRPALAGRKS